MAFLYYLDGTEVNAPINDKELLTTIKRDSNLGGFLITQDADLQWTGAAYTYLYDKFFDEGYCTEVEVLILDQCDSGTVRELYNGIIKMASIIIDEDECTCRTKVQDNSFYAYINNNKSIEVSPTQTGSKMGDEITPPTVYELAVFNPGDGAYWVNTVKGYRVYDLIEHCITVITDGRVGFTSDFLWNQSEELFMTTGNALAVPGNNATFTYSFDTLYSELSKQFNLSFYIEQDDYNIPTVRIEPKNYFYSTAPGITFSDLKDLKISIDQSKIYGTVLLGSQILNDAQAYINFNENIPFYGFKQEKFYPIGQCNLDTELNLVNQYVISHNVIEDCVMNAAPDYYDEIILISCENVDPVNFTAQAKRYDLGGVTPPFLYNIYLNNYSKAQRHFDFLPGNLLDSFNVSSNNFRVEKQVNEVYNAGLGGSATDTPLPLVASGTIGTLTYYDYSDSFEPYDFPDETTPGNYDLGGNYNTVTFTYTIPSDGRYTFNVRLFYNLVRSFSQNQNGTGNIRNLILHIKRYDNAAVFIEETTVVNPIPFILGSYDAVSSASFDALTGDLIRVELEFYVRLFEVTIGSGNTRQFGLEVTGASYFESNSDNVIVGASTLNYKIIKWEFSLPVSQEDFRSLVADPTGIQTFTKWSEAAGAFSSRRAWIDEFKYNNTTGFAQIKLVSNNAIIQE
jgi:hypothetical protein